MLKTIDNMLIISSTQALFGAVVAVIAGALGLQYLFVFGLFVFTMYVGGTLTLLILRPSAQALDNPKTRE